MKKLTCFLSTAVLAIYLTGCVAPVPHSEQTITTNPSTGQAVTNTILTTNYVVDPRFTNVAASVQAATPVVTAIVAATPAAPVAPFIPSATDAVLGLLTIISGAYAAYKNSQANTHQQAAAALASVVPATSQNQAVVNAATPAAKAAVAVHLANAASPV